MWNTRSGFFRQPRAVALFCKNHSKYKNFFCCCYWFCNCLANFVLLVYNLLKQGRIRGVSSASLRAFSWRCAKVLNVSSARNFDLSLYFCSNRIVLSVALSSSHYITSQTTTGPVPSSSLFTRSRICHQAEDGRSQETPEHFMALLDRYVHNGVVHSGTSLTIAFSFNWAKLPLLQTIRAVSE